VIYRKGQELLIGADELWSRLADDTLGIIDCRFDLMDPAAGRESYLNGHIPGAVYADLDADLAAPVQATTGRHPLPEIAVATETFQRLGINRETSIVVYDSAGGAMAARAWWMLRWLGHDRVRILDGGLPCWQAANRPLEDGETYVEPGDLIAAPSGEWVVTTEEVVAWLEAGGDLLLVDARDAVRFRGEVEPIDSVAGHIPGTRNLPFTEALNEDGTFRPEADLEALWGAILGESRDVAWATMCGSGVTACHLAVSALLAGYREPGVYVGSWSEWIRNPDRPIAPGTALDT
jgi:thiosulfate/3-mercaptopyruvate sulfurtransferase